MAEGQTEVMEANSNKQVAMIAPLQFREKALGPNFFLPDEVVRALKPVPQLPPPKSVHKESNHEPSCPVSSRPPASMWFYPRQRKKFQHLLADTICSCGAGKDISFLYDSVSLKPVTRLDALATDMAIRDKSDPSVIRKDLIDQKKLGKKLPAVVSAEEMQIVQNAGVDSLTVYQQGNVNTMSVAEHARHPALLPSMGPTSREQAKHLMQTLDNLLTKIGYGQETEQPTQMHHLLELVKQEQDVYNTVFHELIRQITVECFERGDLLGVLREKYNDLINRIPKQILSLHHELVAQRALDRRLVEELARFQATVTMLSRDLDRAKSHDRLVSEQAKQMEKELKEALRQSERTDELVHHFRQLYELQRSRLENRVSLLVEERDNWVNMSYLVAGKVIDANGLTAARNALQTERSWNTMAVHFSAVLSDKDADLLVKIAGYVQKVQTECNFLSSMAANESEIVQTKLKTLKASMMRMASRQVAPPPSLAPPSQSKDSKESSKKPSVKETVKEPPADPDMFLDRVRRWSIVVSELSELMSGDALLVKRQRVDACKKNFAECREYALLLYRFHKAADGNDLPSKQFMSQVTRQLPTWLENLFVQISGDAGLGAALARYAREIDLWLATTMSQGLDFSRIPGSVQVWIRRTIECIDLYEAAAKVKNLRLADIALDMDNWLSTLNSEISGDNSVISDRSRELHQTWLQWLAQALSRLVPDNPSMSEDQLERSKRFMLPLETLYRAAVNLGRSVDAYSELINLCLRERIEGEDEIRSLAQLRTDARSWLESVWELLMQFMPEDHQFGDHKWAAATMGLSRLRAAINTRAWEEIPESDQLYYASAENQQPVDEDGSSEDEDSDEEAALLLPGPMKKEPSKAMSEPEKEVQKDELGFSPEDGQDKEEVTWIADDGALHSYEPSDPPESRKHLSTLTPGLSAFLPDTQRSASAIPIVETLQEQLLAAEERCRELEVRARKSEHRVGELEDKFRLLEKGPPLPEGQEWRLNDDPGFATLFEKLAAHDAIPDATKMTADSRLSTPRTPQGGSSSKGHSTGRKSTVLPKTPSTRGTKKK